MREKFNKIKMIVSIALFNALLLPQCVFADTGFETAKSGLESIKTILVSIVGIIGAIVVVFGVVALAKSIHDTNQTGGFGGVKGIIAGSVMASVSIVLGLFT